MAAHAPARNAPSLSPQHRPDSLAGRPRLRRAAQDVPGPRRIHLRAGVPRQHQRTKFVLSAGLERERFWAWSRWGGLVREREQPRASFGPVPGLGRARAACWPTRPRCSRSSRPTWQHRLCVPRASWSPASSGGNSAARSCRRDVRLFL